MAAIADHAIGWTIGVAVGFPLTSVLLVELERRFREKSADGAKVCRLLQRTVLPLLGVYLLLNRVGGASPHGAPTKLVLSVLSITAINAVLVAVNAFMRSGARDAEGTPRATGLVLDLARLLVVLIAAAVVAAQIWGVNLGSLLTALGVGSVVIGLAMQDTVSGLFAGLSLLSGRHFKEGDWIEANGVEGRIVHINWRTVTIETLDDNRLVVIPNSSLANTQFTVLSTSTRSFGSNMEIRFAYGSPPARALEAIERAIESVEIVMEDPPYDIDLIGIDDQGILFEATVHAPSRKDGEEAVSEILSKLWYICQREGLVLAGAANRLHGYNQPSGPTDEERSASLEATELFLPSVPGFDRVLQNARHELYDDGEVLLRAGEPFNRLFLVTSGNLAVNLPNDEEHRAVQEVEEGEMFMVRALLTGGPAPVTLRADGEVAVLSIEAAVVLGFLNENPALAGRVEQTIDITEQGLSTIRNKG